ncbi:MAG: cell division protein FtsQ/DivIB [Thermodesulfobacteriota bacterium]
MNKSPVKNRYKREPVEKRKKLPGFKPVMGLACIVLTASLALIFLHDFVVQMHFFDVAAVTVKGNSRVPDYEIIELAGIKQDSSVLGLNLFSVEKRLGTHPWINNASVERKLPSGISIRIQEQQPLAIVKIENLADILINTEGMPFKEYSPQTDRLSALPVISGLELTRVRDRYMFNSRLFNSVFDALNQPDLTKIKHIEADRNTGITVTGKNSDTGPRPEREAVSLKLGFSNYAEKVELAGKIETYFEKRFERKIISSIDLFNPDHIIVKTKRRSSNCRETKT